MQRHDGSRVVWGPQGKGRGIVKQCRSSKGSCKHAPLVGGTLQSVLTQSVLRPSGYAVWTSAVPVQYQKP